MSKTMSKNFDDNFVEKLCRKLSLEISSKTLNINFEQKNKAFEQNSGNFLP